MERRARHRLRMRRVITGMLITTAAGGCESPRTSGAAAEPTFIAHGACPFECCRYGAWRLETDAIVRAEPRTSADSMGFIPAGSAVRADSGLVIVRPIGRFLVTGPVPAGLETDSVRFNPGDTVEILDYRGEGFWRVRHRGALLDAEQYWDSLGSRGARLLRSPAQAWWALLTDPQAGTTGWVLMDSVRVDGADACG